MLFIIKVIVASFVIEGITHARDKSKLAMLPDTYKDVFSGGEAKPRLGTTSGTCWIRGGVCTHIRNCPSLNFDISVSGCTTRFKVCCRNFPRLPPTVGALRARESSEIFGETILI